MRDCDLKQNAFSAATRPQLPNRKQRLSTNALLQARVVELPFPTHSFIAPHHINPSSPFTTLHFASRLPEFMFKKPVASLKSFSPLRSSDKRRLRDEILTSFPELKEMETPIPDTPISTVITPEGLQSAKYTSYIEEPGTMYTDAEGTPLWFKISCSKKEALIVPSRM